MDSKEILLAGLCLEIAEDSRSASDSLRIVDLAECEESHWWRLGRVTVTWRTWKGSSHWRTRQQPDRILLIEGQPDRFPGDTEPLDRWLKDRWGSFRGIEVQQDGTSEHITVFVDPLGTRPLFYRTDGGRTLIADKLATLAVNSRISAEPDWGALLEAGALASVYSDTTTLSGAVQLKPGQCVRFSHGKVSNSYYHSLPGAGQDRERIRKDAQGTLLEALKRAVTETWTDRDSHLLLSGGLDSRLTLMLAGTGRKAMTVTAVPNQESRLAEEIAAACKADFLHFPRSSDHYFNVLRNGVLLTGAAADSFHSHHLGLPQQWRQQGIQAVTNAYLFDTILKAWFTFPARRYYDMNPTLTAWIGPKSFCFQKRSGRISPSAAEDFIGLLSSEGRSVLQEQLALYKDQFRARAERGIDLTLESRIFERVFKQPHYAIFLAWIEGQDVSTPIFHPALFEWARESDPWQRYGGRAFRGALLATGHAASGIVDSNTGQIPSVYRMDWRERAAALPVYPLIMNIRVRLQKLQPDPPQQSTNEGSWGVLGSLLTDSRGQELIEAGIAELEGNPLWNIDAVRQAIAAVADGDGRFAEPVVAAATVGHWKRVLCQGRHFSHRAVTTISTKI
jgi:hypothetical protein